MQLSELSEERLEQCPYCGEPISVVVDCSAGDQTYVEDCPVCCQPIVFEAAIDANGWIAGLVLRREND